MTSIVHDEFCLCRACDKRLLAAHDAYLKAWLIKATQRAVVAAALAAFLTLPTTAHAQTGIASVYSTGEQGNRTASGIPLRNNALTAAHRTLPFGTKVRVTNLRNHRSVVVRITDRGPFVGGRIIDLSVAAARALAMDGVAHVSVEVV